MIRQTFSIVKELVNEYIEDDGFTKGAALAYYTTFSIAPIIFIIIAIAGVFFGHAAVKGEVYDQLSGLLGQDAAETIQTVVEASYNQGGNFWITVLGIVTLIFGATGAFNQLKLSLNQIWAIESKPVNGILGFLKARGISFAMVIGLGFVLLVSLVVDALASGLGQKFAMNLGSIGETGLSVIIAIISLVLSVLIFAAIFKFLPDARVHWKEVMYGSLFTAVLFALGRSGIGYYIGNSSITTGFGAAGSLVALLVWTYYSSQTIFLGAELMWVLGKRNNRPILPGKEAVLIVKQTKKIDSIRAEAALDDGVNEMLLPRVRTRKKSAEPGFTHHTRTRRKPKKD